MARKSFTTRDHTDPFSWGDNRSKAPRGRKYFTEVVNKVKMGVVLALKKGA